MTQDSILASEKNPNFRYGLGVMMNLRDGVAMHGHTGGTNGYVSTFRRLPGQDAAVVALSNQGPAGLIWEEEAVAAAMR